MILRSACGALDSTRRRYRPVANTLMIEPTGLELGGGRVAKGENVPTMSPHTQRDLLVGDWNGEYTCERAAYGGVVEGEEVLAYCDEVG